MILYMFLLFMLLLFIWALNSNIDARKERF